VRAVWSRADLVLATITCVAGLSVVMALRDSEDLGITLVLAGATYLVIHYRGGIQEIAPVCSRSNVRIWLAATVAFMALFSLSVALVFAEVHEYGRPPAYFAVVGLMAAAVTLQVAALPARRTYAYVSLAQVVLTGVSLQWTPQLLFPSLMGVDVFAHSTWVQNLLDLAHIPADFPYASFPVMHLVLGTASLVAGTGYKLSGLIAAGVPYALIMVLVFLAGERLLGTKIGLLSALLLSISNWYIHGGLHSIPNTIGTSLVIFCLVLVTRNTRSLAHTCVTLLVVATTIVTHTVATFVLAVALYAYGVARRLWATVTAEKSSLYLMLASLVAVGTVTYWWYVSGFDTTIVQALRNSLRIDTKATAEMSSYLASLPRAELLLNRAGLLALSYLGLTGFLALLGRRLATRETVAYSAIAAAIAALTLLASVGDYTYLLADRQLTYYQILFSVPAAVGAVLLSSLFAGVRVQRTALVSVVFVLALASITSPQANPDRPFYSPNTAYRFAYTTSEVAAATRLANVAPAGLLTDASYGGMVSALTAADVSDMHHQLESRDFATATQVVLLRTYTTERLASGSGGFFKLNYHPGALLDKPGFGRTYSSRGVTGYVPLKHTLDE